MTLYNARLFTKRHVRSIVEDADELADKCNTLADDLAEMDDGDLDSEDRSAARDSAWDTVNEIVALAEKIAAARDKALGTGLAHTHQVGPHAAGLVCARPPGDPSLREALAEPVATVEDGGLLPYEIRRLADPVEAVAWVVRAHKFRDRNVTRSGAPDDTDRTDARELLAALVAGPWHLVTLADNSMTGRVHEISDVHGIDQEWRP